MIRGSRSASCWWPWRQTIDQVQVFPKQIPRHGHLGKLERNIATVANDLGADFHQLIVERVQ
jgi:hypothetical protein